ncbi:hypothetical protein Q5752_000873 [Cryptotrichosporon argae]
MGRVFRLYLAGEAVFVCKQCRNHLAVSESVISRAFHGQHGRAYLIHHAVNVYNGPPEIREMRTGQHVVRDTHCSVCSTVVGWKYDTAYQHDQKYKEGRYILERECIVEVAEPKLGAGATKLGIEEVPVQELMAKA